MSFQSRKQNGNNKITDFKTKIVCTLGPASSGEKVLSEMIEAGMDVVRLNFSHGADAEKERLFNLVRQLSAKYDNQVAIVCDIQGPKIRTGSMDFPFTLNQGDEVRVTTDKPGFVGNRTRFSIQYESMLNDLKEGDFIFINDGICRLVVVKKDGDDLVCVTEAGGDVSNNKGCNIPSGNISLDVITDKDRHDLELIAKLDPEFVASSFIGTAEDVLKVKAELAKHGNTKIKVISKIERPVALENIDAIIEVSDGVMVARGDLGVEIPAFEVPSAQKMIVSKCNRIGRPVIVATQMLESMTANARPTRAEASDVFNAVLDGADAVMLSGETSVGKYPVDSVSYMDDIVGTAEKHLARRDPQQYDSPNRQMMELVAHGIYELAGSFSTMPYQGKIVCLTRTGRLPVLISKYRPALPIIVVTSNIRVQREMCLVWGVHSIFNPELPSHSVEKRWGAAVTEAVNRGLLNEESDHVLCASASELLDEDAEITAGKVGVICGTYKVKTMLQYYRSLTSRRDSMAA